MSDKYRELREVAEHATPGPWKYSQECHDGAIEVTAGKYCVARAIWLQGANLKNAKFMSRADPTTITELLRERDALLGLLGVARCPDQNCDNKGTTMEPIQVCCRRGDDNGCCGDPEIDFDAAPCQWCHERTALIESAKRQEG